MSTDKVPVTVIIPCFRCTLTIKRAIYSIVQQTQKPVEVILVEDASGDDTLDVLNEIEKQHSGWVKVISLSKNLGAGSSRNVGWALATQPYIAFLDADDAWHPKKIEIQYTFMSNHPDMALSGHMHRVLQKGGDLPNWAVSFQYQTYPICKGSLLLSNSFITPSVMLRSDITKRFAEGSRHMEDHMLWLEIVCCGGKVAKLSTELAAIYKAPFGDAGLSSQIWLMQKGDLNNYKTLLEIDCINISQWLILSLYSWIKFMRRIIICYGGFR